jgi:hypothetical protein
MAPHLQGRQTAGASAGRSRNGRRGQDGHGGQGQEDVIDAEFEVKK